MPCYYPQGAYRLNGEPVRRPCGYCIGCRLEHSRQWAIRCVHETQVHDENCFLTLTYNNESLPEGGSLRKKDLQLFIRRLKRLKETEKDGIRYYGCGEYGDELGRPHYHLLVFNYDFKDKEVIQKDYRFRRNRFSKSDIKTLYKSKELEEIWKKGFCSIGDVDFESAAYVARYTMKKYHLTPTERAKGKNIDEHYRGKEVEFAIMSKRPGIGKLWFDRYKGDVYPKDFFTLKGRKMRPPRYYDDLLKKKDKKMMEKIKEDRIKNQEEHNQKRLWQRNKHREIITKKLERKLHNE